MPILPKRLNSGDGGIRTPRPFRITCFRDRLPARLAHIPISAAHRSRTCKPVLPAHCLPDSSSTIEGLRRIVGRVGLEPTSPRATVLQTACFIRFAYLPILYERCERDSNPQSVITDHRFSRPARYLLRHHSGKYPGGIRTSKSFRTHGSGSCQHNHFHAPGQVLNTGEGS